MGEVEEGERGGGGEKENYNLPRCVSLGVPRALSPGRCPEVQRCLLGRQVGAGDWEARPRVLHPLPFIILGLKWAPDTSLPLSFT